MNELEYQEETMDEEPQEENNEDEKEELEASNKLNKKILKRMISFIISGLLFVLMFALNIKNKLSNSISINSKYDFIRIIGIGTMIIAFLLCIFFIIDLLTHQKLTNKLGKIQIKIKNIIYNIFDYLLILPLCALVANFLFGCVFSIAEISGASMMPTLVNGEEVLVLYNKEIEFQSVVVCYINEDDNYIDMNIKYSSGLIEGKYEDYYVKRVIGMPGDSISWDKDAGLTVNGKYVEEEYLSQNYTSTASPVLEVFYYENGEKNYVEVNELGEYVIPEGYYFVMGDNRNNSTDSRKIGLIKEENIIGVVTRHMKVIIPGDEVK